MSFTRVPNAVLRDATLSRGSRLTYIMVASYAWGEKDHCYPGQGALAGNLGCSERTVRDYLDELVSAGLIEKRHRGQGKTDNYTIRDSTYVSARNQSSVLDRNDNSTLGRNQSSDKERQAEQDKFKNLPGGAAAPQQGKAIRAEGLVSKLVVRLGEVGYHLDPEQKAKYGANFGKLIAAGIVGDEMHRVLARIISEWSRIQLSPQQALTDLRGGRRPDHSPQTVLQAAATPEPALDAIRAHADLSGFSHVAEAFDFTGMGVPSGKWWFALGGTDRERGDNATRLRSVACRAMRDQAPAQGTITTGVNYA